METWREHIEKERARAGDNSSWEYWVTGDEFLGDDDPGKTPLVLACRIFPSDVWMDEPWAGCGGRDFTLWTESRTYFPCEYDSSWWVGSVPRYPCEEVTGPQGEPPWLTEFMER